jgi:hypothetical protein
LEFLQRALFVAAIYIFNERYVNVKVTGESPKTLLESEPVLPIPSTLMDAGVLRITITGDTEQIHLAARRIGNVLQGSHFHNAHGEGHRCPDHVALTHKSQKNAGFGERISREVVSQHVFSTTQSSRASIKTIESPQHCDVPELQYLNTL